MYRGKGKIFNYDFEKQFRDHKLNRERFSFGGFEVKIPGFTITDKCIACGKCDRICTFGAIIPGKHQYSINGNRCDEYGNCIILCPVDAISKKQPHKYKI